MSSAKLQIIFTSIFALTSANTSAGIEQFSGVSKRVKFCNQSPQTILYHQMKSSVTK